MKLTKKLIPAIGMLMLSMVMLVTSSFAWFSMNDTVTAQGMNVTAVGEQIYLQIVSGTTADFSDTANPYKVATVSGKSSLRPAAVVKKIDSIGEGVDSVDPYTGAGSGYSWVTNYSSAVNEHEASGKYTNADSASYYLKNSFMIRLDATAGLSVASNPLRVSNIKLTSTNSNEIAECVSVLVVCGTKTQLFKQTSYNDWEEIEAATNGKLTETEFADTTGTKVDVYVFFDGENENCTLANLAKLEAEKNDYVVTVEFSVGDPA